MEFEFRVSTMEGSEVLYTFQDFEGDNLDMVVDSFKKFLHISGYDITRFEDEE